MALLLETTLGDIVVDLDLDGSPTLCRNFIKLAKARYYTNTLVYSIQPGRFCQLGDPKGDGTGGCSIYGLIDSIHGAGSRLRDETRSTKRFLKSDGRKLTKSELLEKGRVVAIEMGGVSNTIGSQFIITTDSGEGRALDGLNNLDNSVSISANGDEEKQNFFSLGVISEDENDVIGKINALYCDKDGRPYADVRIIRAHILDDPYDDPTGMEQVLEARKITLLQPSDLPEKHAACARWLSSASPEYTRPPGEVVEIRISAVEALAEEDEKKRQEELQEKEDKSRAVVLEMLGDLPSADMKPPENVLFVCKLNSVTDDEDLQLIFSRFDPDARAEIIRDPISGDSLQYAFVEFATKEQCTEAYFKMNNALIDDRRIKVDFSQSVAKVWNKYAKRRRANENNKKGRVEHVSHDLRKNKNEAINQRSTQNVRDRRLDEQERSRNRLRREADSTQDIGRHCRPSRSPSSRSTATGRSHSSRENRPRNSKKRERKHRDDKHRRNRHHRHRREDDDQRRHKNKKRSRHRYRTDEEETDKEDQSQTERRHRRRNSTAEKYGESSKGRHKLSHRSDPESYGRRGHRDDQSRTERRHRDRNVTADRH